MKLSHYQYGHRAEVEGLAIGVTRTVPRGISKQNYACGYFDVWLPILAPSCALLSEFKKHAITFEVFTRRYQSEMRSADPSHVIQLVAAMALRQPVALGCFCLDPGRCHRSILYQLVLDAAASLPMHPEEHRTYASPPCSMPEIDV
jgi:uncharacterized protein YeaO (DUF488 family)